MIKQLLNSAIAKIVIYQWLTDQLFASAFGISKFDLLATDKSRYFAQSRPIIV